MLSLMWDEDFRPFITAVASLSNYTGGALAVVIIPVIAKDGEVRGIRGGSLFA